MLVKALPQGGTAARPGGRGYSPGPHKGLLNELA